MRNAAVQGRDCSVPQKARRDIHTSSLSFSVPIDRKQELLPGIIPWGTEFCRIEVLAWIGLIDVRMGNSFLTFRSSSIDVVRIHRSLFNALCVADKTVI